MFRHYHRHPRFRGRASLQSYTPLQVARLYNFPTSAAGQKLAFISLGGDLVQSDLDALCKLEGIPSPKVTVHTVAGATRASDPGGADVENMLDASCQSVAVGAEIHMFLAPNTDAGFAAAVQAAVDFLPAGSAISISWGAPENQWSTSAIVAMNNAFKAAQAKGINVFVAAGDNGSGDGESGNHVDFPASSVYVVGCGGTSIRGTAPLVEQVWNDGTQGGATGGGVSADFVQPAFQSGLGLPSANRRCVPDIALNADPESGYVMFDGGQQTVVGGTSGAAPMAAALCACITAALGKPLGDWNRVVYPLFGQATRDITVGNNGTFIAKSGPDCCTGGGVPDGKKLLAALAAPAPQPVPTPAPTPPPVVVSRTLVVSGTNLAVTVDGHAV